MDESEDNDDRNARPPSPCILLCTLDDNNRCLGCDRSLKQISAWAMMSVKEQWSVIDELAARQTENDVTIAANSGE